MGEIGCLFSKDALGKVCLFCIQEAHTDTRIDGHVVINRSIGSISDFIFNPQTPKTGKKRLYHFRIRRIEGSTLLTRPSIGRNPYVT